MSNYLSQEKTSAGIDNTEYHERHRVMMLRGLHL